MKSTPICLALAALFATGSAHAAGDARLRAQLEKMVAEIVNRPGFRRGSVV